MTVAQLTAKISVVGADAARQAFNRLGTSARSMGETIRTAADSMRLLEVAGNILAKGSGISVAMAFDSQVRALAAYANNAQELEAQLVRLNEIAKLPGLGQSEVRMGVLSLEAAGLNAKMAERAVATFGNALALAGKGKSELDGVILALGQIASKGKISAEEINQMAERVPQIRQALIGAFGTAQTEQIQKMGISATDAINRILVQMEKLPKATSGAQVNFENMADAIDAMVLPIGRGLLDMFQATTDSGGNLIASLTKISTAIGEVFSALGNSGVVTRAFDMMVGGVENFGLTWQQQLAVGLTQFVTFIGFIPRQFRAMVKDIGNVWETFFYNGLVYWHNFIEDIIAGIQNIGIEFNNQLNIGIRNSWNQLMNQLSGGRIPLEVIQRNAHVKPYYLDRRSYTEEMDKVGFDYAMSLAGNVAGVLANLGKQRLPDGLNFRRPGAQAGAGAAAGDAEKKHKDTKDLLQRIEGNTRQTADILDLRNQTLGGGRLGQIGVTGSELAGMGMRVHSELSKAKPISSDTMVTRGIKQMIQNNLGFAVNGGRAIPIR